MKSMKNSWLIAGLMCLSLGSSVLVACAGSSFNTSDDNSDGYGGNYLYPTCTTSGCPTYGSVGNAGFYAQTSNFYVPGYVNAGSTLQIKSGMATMLREAMGVCDRQDYSGGYAACSQWLSGAHDLVLLTENGSTSNTVKMIVRSVPAAYANGAWYSYSFPSFQETLLNVLGFPTGGNRSGVFDPMVLSSTIWPVNNNQGFEVRANGPRLSYGWNKLLQLQVANGKLEDSKWSFTLYYNGIAAMSGTAVRCQSQYCGLDGSFFSVSQ